MRSQQNVVQLTETVRRRHRFAGKTVDGGAGDPTLSERFVKRVFVDDSAAGGVGLAAVQLALKAGAIVNDEQLKAELAGPEYSENAQGIVLERKEDMRGRGLGSPDIADALALTFAAPVFTQLSLAGRGDHLVQTDYNPFSDAAMQGEPYPEARGRFYAEGWAKLKPEYEDTRPYNERTD